MRPAWILPLGILILLFAPAAAADPIVSMPSVTQGVAMWAFTDLANYTASGTSLAIGEATLAQIPGTVTDSQAGEFAQALASDNVDTASRPGDVVLANTSRQGPVTGLDVQPGPSQLEDNYLWSGGSGNWNFGLSPDLFVGYWGNPEWTRAVLHWSTLPLPANATLISATLRLYMHAADTPAVMNISVHRMTTAWTELGSTWNDYDGSNPWNASGGGGDFDPAVLDIVAGVTTGTGWYGWNVTSAARDWWAGTSPNCGLLLRQANDDLRIVEGRKEFYSSDAANASARPRLVLTYTTPSSTGFLESRVLVAGTPSAWQRVRWNASLPAGAALLVQTRTGGTPTIGSSWSPWSAPASAPGAAITSPAGAYAQYRATLFTPTTSSPVLHDISLDFEHYRASGTIDTKPLLPGDLVAWDTVQVDWTGPAGTNVTLEASSDGGSSWTPAPPGSNLTGVPTQAVTLRATLTTDNGTATPHLRSLLLSYTRRGGGGGFPSLPLVGPYWILLVPVLILGAWALAIVLRRSPFHPSDVFLIHTDGRLILRVGGRESPLQDEIAVSGMFTLVARFVRDSFQRAGGEKGELKDFRVDDREVTVARGEYLFLALVGTGTPFPGLEGNLARFLERLEATQRATLAEWDGLHDGLDETRRMLTVFLRKEYRRRRVIGGGSGP